MDGMKILIFFAICVTAVHCATYVLRAAGGPNVRNHFRSDPIPDAGLGNMAVQGDTSNVARNRAAPLPPPVDTSQVAVQTLITAEVNRLRRIPAATNMFKMSWDVDVQGRAQLWANRCKFEHPNPADKSSRYTALGQNIAMNYGSSGPMSWNATIKMWYDEVNQFQYGVGPINNAVVGHYTALVWAASQAIGCGYTACGPQTTLGASVGGTAYFYVCDFGPAGNVIPNQYKPYEQGPRCSKCPNNGACDAGLCIPPVATLKTCPYTDVYSNCAVASGTYPALFPNGKTSCLNASASLAPLRDSCKATCNCDPGTF